MEKESGHNVTFSECFGGLSLREAQSLSGVAEIILIQSSSRNHFAGDLKIHLLPGTASV